MLCVIFFVRAYNHKMPIYLFFNFQVENQHQFLNLYFLSVHVNYSTLAYCSFYVSINKRALHTEHLSHDQVVV